MNTVTKLGALALLLTALINLPVLAEEGHEHEEKAEAHEEEAAESSGIKISPKKREEAGIVVEVLKLETVAQTVRMPGEVKINNYKAQVITPRIDSMVMERHVVLGDHVKKGQPLATLFSVDVAEAQGAFILASKAWQRAKKLGKDIISSKRYAEAKVKYQQSRARLQAYGMAKKEINKLLENNKSKAGHFQLVSNQSGVITSDNFRAGELIEPGRVLFDVVDESLLWVEAHVSPDLAQKIKQGDNAWVHLGSKSRKAKVAQKNHVLDEKTRTLAIRLELDNKDHVFAPGQFVDVEIAANAGKPALAIPAEAVLRSSDGDWQIFTEDADGDLTPVEVGVIRTAGDKKVITGVPAGTKVVTKGAFFVQSEIAKGGFDIHNH